MALTKISGEVIQQPINIGVITATSVTATSATFSDNVSIGAGATTAFFEVDTGNVGIGTDNPFYKFEVRGDTNTEIRIGNFDDSEAGILLSNTGSTNRRIVAADGDMIFRGGNSTSDEHVRIKQGGRVGIGTTQPRTILEITGGSAPHLIVGHSGNNSAQRQSRVSFGFDDGEGACVQSTRPNGGTIENCDISFRTGGTTGVHERLGIGTDGNVSITNGNLVFSTSGTGIDFQNAGISSTTVQNHILDDYEEGTWTPGYDTSTTSSSAISYNNQVGGSYIKIGRAVYICGRCRTDSSQSLDGTGNIVLTGLPFAISDGFDDSSDTQDTSAIFSVQQIDGWNDPPLVLLGQTGGSVLDLYKGGTLAAPVVVADFGTGGGGINRMRFSGFYFTDS